MSLSALCERKMNAEQTKCKETNSDNKKLKREETKGGLQVEIEWQKRTGGSSALLFKPVLKAIRLLRANCRVLDET